MRAELRDAKIAAAKAEGRVTPTTTLAQRRAARHAEKYRGWRLVRPPQTVNTASSPTLPRPAAKGKPPRYSTEGMALSRKSHSGALRGGRPRHRHPAVERKAA